MFKDNKPVQEIEVQEQANKEFFKKELNKVKQVQLITSILLLIIVCLIYLLL